MSQTNRCRLCVNVYKDSKSLYDDYGRGTELYDITYNYFHPRILNMRQWRHLTGICLQCFRHICDFHSFQASVQVAQLELIEEVNADIAVKSEPIEILDEFEDDGLLHDYPNPTDNHSCYDTSMHQADGNAWPENNPYAEDYNYSNEANAIEDSLSEETLLMECDFEKDNIPIGENNVTQESTELVNVAPNVIEATYDDDHNDSQESAELANMVAPNVIEGTYEETPLKISAVQTVADSFKEHNTLPEDLTPDHYAVEIVADSFKVHNTLPEDLTPEIDAAETVADTFKVHNTLPEDLTPDIDAVEIVADSCKEHNTPDDIDDFVLHWKPILKCDLCSDSCSKLSLLQEHFRLRHDNVNCYISCCGRKFSETHKIKKHASKHLDPSSFKCDLCGYCFTNQHNLKRHVLGKHLKFKIHGRIVTSRLRPKRTAEKPDNATKVVDEVAPNVVDMPNAAETEAILNNTQDDNSPPKCSSRLARLQELDDLIVRWKPILKCELCPESYAKFSLLQHHFRQKHADEKCYISCCNRTFSTSGKIKQHVLQHVDPNALKCTFCNKSFSNRHNLQRHALTSHLVFNKQSATSTKMATKRKLVRDGRNNISIPSAEGGKRYRRSNKWLGELDDLISKWKPTIKCDLCPETCAKFSLLEEHFRQQHVDEKCYISCCDRRFSARPKIEEHVLQHINPNVFKCELCDSRFTVWVALKKHLLRQHPEVHNKKYECVKCDRRFPTKQGLRIHFTFAHAKLIQQRTKRADKVGARPVHKCTKCGKQFSNRTNLNRHIRVIHKQSKKQISNKKTASKRQLLGKYVIQSQSTASEEVVEPANLNISKETGPGGVDDSPSSKDAICYRRSKQWLGDLDELIGKWKPILKCDLCPESYPKLSLLEEHFHQQHPNEKFFITCCDRRLSPKSKIEEHVQQHIDPNAFKCNLCGSQFTLRITLNRHLVAKHPDVYHKMYECKKCNKTFSTSTGMKIHFSWAHVNLAQGPDKASPLVNVRPVNKCNKCGKCFASRQSLKRHVLLMHLKAQKQKTNTKTASKRKLTQDLKITTAEPQEVAEFENAPITENIQLVSADVAEGVDGQTPEVAVCYRRSKKWLEELDELVAKWQPILKCELCTESCSKFSLLEDHFRQQHAAEKCYISCCDRRFSARPKIEEHVLQHVDPNAFKCDLCESRFTMWDALKKHVLAQHPEVQQQMYGCEKCDKRFLTRLGLKIHCTSVHGRLTAERPKSPAKGKAQVKAPVKVRPVNKCQKCGKSFTKRGNLKRHVLVMHLKAKKPIANTKIVRKKLILRLTQAGDKHQASTSFAQAADENSIDADISSRVVGGGNIPSAEGGNRHRRSNKWLGELDDLIVKWKPSLKCELCPESFAKFSLLEDHVRQQHADAKCYISCCDRRFSAKPKIEEHVLLHVDPNALKCDLCESRFTTWDALKRHLVARHPEVHHKKYECVKCDKRFHTKQGLKIHCTSVHAKIEAQRPTVVPLRTGNKCHKCGKSFSNRANLKRHMLVIHQKLKKPKIAGKNKLVLKSAAIKEPAEVAPNAMEGTDGISKDNVGEGEDKIPSSSKCAAKRKLLPKSAAIKEPAEVAPNAMEGTEEGGGNKMPLSTKRKLLPKSAAIKEPAEVAPNAWERADDISEGVADKLTLSKKRLENLDELIAKWRPILTCELCSESCASFSLLEEHFRQQHADETCYISCCNRRLSKRHKIKEHVVQHLEPNAFKCDRCDKSFTMRNNLRRHMALQHAGDIHNQYECETCHKRFSTKQGLNLHGTVVHAKQGEQSVSGSIKVIVSVPPLQKCKKCSKSFTSSSNLNKHMLIAHGPNLQHKCKACGQSFKWFNQLLEHSTIHTGKDIYACLFCPLTFKHYISVYKHRKKAHPHEGGPKYYKMLM